DKDADVKTSARVRNVVTMVRVAVKKHPQRVNVLKESADESGDDLGNRAVRFDDADKLKPRGQLRIVDVKNQKRHKRKRISGPGFENVDQLFSIGCETYQPERE